MKKVCALCLAAIMMLGAGFGAKAILKKKEQPGSISQAGSSGFIKAQGERLVIEGTHTPIRLQGINVTNSYWGDPEDMLQGGSGIKDYENIKAMGMNVVRLSLNHGMFEDEANPYTYKKEAWEWVDRNIRQARANGLWVILDMHIPVGGNWLSADEPQDYSIWTDVEKQKRFKALWKAIATRYKNNTSVAAYDLMNEPITDDADGAVYKTLIEETVETVRSVDMNHLLIIEKLYGVDSSWEVPEGVKPQFLVDDPNVMYDFHFYQPIEYTHQYADWVEDAGDGGSYPDELLCTLPENATYLRSKGEAYIPEGDSPWTYMETESVALTNTDETLATPVLYCDGGFQSCSFSQLMLQELDASGNVLRNVPLKIDEVGNQWQWWSEDESGSAVVKMTGGPKGEPAIEVAGVQSYGALTADKATVVLQKDRKYKLSGWVKGNGLKAEAGCGLQMDFYKASESTLETRNKVGLANALDQWLAFGKENKVPVNVGEWGVIYHCYENGKGGEQWVSDMLDLLIERNVNFQFWDYHSESMGIYQGEGLEPIENAKVNQGVVDLFKMKLHLN